MSLEHAILGFLNYKPFSGYDLKKLFDTSIRHFWPADQAQIYRTLGRLSHHGWASVQIVSQDNRPNRKLFSITDEGRQELHRWLINPVPAEDTRSATLIQVFFAAQLEDEQILAIFERVAGLIRALLQTYEQIPGQVESYKQMVDSPREIFFWMLTLECGITMARAQLKWIEDVIRRIKAGEHNREWSYSQLKSKYKENSK
jgi:DNA-binding PadR family transcriptional regulator